MGRDPYFSDRRPSVYINGEKYRYGRTDDGWLVEHESYGKWYWDFETRQACLDFLQNLPESSYQAVVDGRVHMLVAMDFPREDVQRLHEEHKEKLRQLLELRRALGLARRFDLE